MDLKQRIMQEPATEAMDRRPIATRNRKWAQAATVWLASRNVSPNAISIAGMCACIVAGIALAATSITDNRTLWIIAALGAQLRLTANMLDGMVALASGHASKIGKLYNELPDRVSDAAVFIGAGFAWGENIPLGAETNVPVVPCGLAGAFEALPPDRKLPRPVAIKLVIGHPLEFASTANDRAGWSQIAASVESCVRALVA